MAPQSSCFSFWVLLLAFFHQATSTRASQAGIVEWDDANWKDDGTAQLPLGNGDATAGVWVSKDTGDLRLLVSTSSAFNENSHFVHIGALRLTLDPPLLSSNDNNHSVKQRLDPTTASVAIHSGLYSIRVYVDAHAPVVRVSLRSHHGTFSARASLEPYRRYEPSPIGDWGACDGPSYDHYDTIVNATQAPQALKSSVTWYHANPENASRAFFEDNLKRHGMDPKQFPNLFLGRIFGGSLSSQQLQPTEGDGLTLQGSDLQSAEIQISLLSERPATPASWVDHMAQQVTTYHQNNQNTTATWSNHKTTWDQLWNRSYVTLSPRPNITNATTTDLLNAHFVWERYLNLIQGRQAQAPIKFNGQAFTANQTGGGWDARNWGSGYWWQNTRQPYYNSLMQGDTEILDGMISFYYKMMPYARARTYQQFKDTDKRLPEDAVFFPETTTAFGTFYAGDWDGCEKTKGKSRPHGMPKSQWIGLHYTGGLELSLLILDRYQWTQDAQVLEQHLEIILGVVSAFVHRFPIPEEGGKIDLFPAQSLESWQCKNPENRSDCVTNPTPEIAGLTVVLQRLLQLPDTLVSSYQKEFWTNYTKALPPIPTTDVHGPTVIAPGQRLPPHAINSENTELYPVHPYRLYAVGKPNLELAQATFQYRPFPCNNGWCQDVIDAAMLNLTQETVTLMEDRVLRLGHGKYFRFLGFGNGYQDYEPGMDHFSTLQIAANMMLLTPLDDGAGGFLVFPGFPSEAWNVEFKLHAPNNTIVEASCQNGELVRLNVYPPENKDKILHTGNCRVVSTATASVA